MKSPKELIAGDSGSNADVLRWQGTTRDIIEAVCSLLRFRPREVCCCHSQAPSTTTAGSGTTTGMPTTTYVVCRKSLKMYKDPIATVAKSL
eukprot:5422977-Amphidinium_carterae.1